MTEALVEVEMSGWLSLNVQLIQFRVMCVHSYSTPTECVYTC